MLQPVECNVSARRPGRALGRRTRLPTSLLLRPVRHPPSDIGGAPVSTAARGPAATRRRCCGA